MDIGIVRGLLTVALMILFIGVWAWSFSRRRRNDFDRAAQMPLEDGDNPPSLNANKERIQ